MNKAYNFSAGPAMLPEYVMEKIQSELLEYGNSKASVMEISHRGLDFMEMSQKMEQDLRDLMDIPDNYKVLFLQGGASSQFSMVPINILRGKSTANYVNSGQWSLKAIAEADRYCDVHICADSKGNGYTDIADFDSWSIDDDGAYLHYTPNETIAGLEFDYVPEIDMPVVADMSSTILSRPCDVSKFGVIYAGAQKNIGPSGMTVVIIREDLIGRVIEKQPVLFDYSTQSNNNSMYNTPSTFPWYAAGQVFQWLKDCGGLTNMANINKEKSQQLYKMIDNSDFYSNPVKPRYRSWMNVPFVLADGSLDKLFLEKSYNANLLALKGHKSVGGMRASIYNAMPIEGVNQLIDFMKVFEAKYG